MIQATSGHSAGRPHLSGDSYPLLTQDVLLCWKRSFQIEATYRRGLVFHYARHLQAKGLLSIDNSVEILFSLGMKSLGKSMCAPAGLLSSMDVESSHPNLLTSMHAAMQVAPDVQLLPECDGCYPHGTPTLCPIYAGVRSL